MPAIAVERLEKKFGYSSVLRGVSLGIEAGQCYVLFGDNGAGKTTLLRILATIQRPSSGRFAIDGCDGVKERDEVRRKLFLITHRSHLYDELSGLENLHFALGLRGLHRNQEGRSGDAGTGGAGGFRRDEDTLLLERHEEAPLLRQGHAGAATGAAAG